MLLRISTSLCALAVLLSIATQLSADISMPKLFSDHMVLQQNRALKVWGTADPNQEMVVKFSRQTKTTKADANGNWSVAINTGAAGGPFELVVSDSKEKTKVKFSNVLVGEVWICGGQANMQMPVSETITAETDIELAKEFPTIRLFNVEEHAAIKPMNEFAKVNPWYCCSSETIKDFSAIGYFFGRELSKKLNVPIGLINISRSGITLESWTPYDALQADGTFAELLEHWQVDSQPNNPNRVSNSFNAMVSPLTQFPIGGVIWYQGESNIGRGDQYARLFPVMIESWRNKFNDKDCPFYFVQLAPHRYENFSVEALPEIWDAQLKTFNNTKDTGMVITTDIGDGLESKRKDKLLVARRLAQWAFGNCYKKAVAKETTAGPRPSESVSANRQPDISQATDQPSTVKADDKPSTNSVVATTTNPINLASGNNLYYSGPVFQNAEVKDGKVIVSFKFAESGLRMSTEFENSFTICGEDQKFVSAYVEIDGSTIVVSHEDVPNPVAVRYGWQDTAKPILSNKAGLPASPFRTDNFPLSSKGIEF